MPREVRLRSTAGLRGTPALALCAWQGRSGRRYVVGVHGLTETDLTEIGDAVVIAVRRDSEGLAVPVAVGSNGRSPRERLPIKWFADALGRGATEMHVHRLAENEDERRAIVDDLSLSEPEPAGSAAL